MKIKIIVASLLFSSMQGTLSAQALSLAAEAETSLKKAVTYFYSINSHGGYVYFVTPDLSRRWGEGPKDAETIEVQPPGTPSVGQSFLRVYKTIGDENALQAAKEAAYALIDGQNQYGGWEHTINFANISHEKVSFDDNQTQSAISFLMALDQVIDDDKLESSVGRALKMMITTQLENGGWPHQYPEQGNYHDYATFNDGGINDCIRVMLEAYQYYGENEPIKDALYRAARFMNISQLPPPQPGWAQQYNEYLQPAWARTFEPPAVCSSVTVNNLQTLMDLYQVLGHTTLLEPIPDAIRWLREIKMENGKWARFVELGTNKALYYDRPRIRVNSLDELHPERRTGYAYEVDLQERLDQAEARYHKAIELTHKEFCDENRLSIEEVKERMMELEPVIKEILATQDATGAWITKNDRFKKHIIRTRTQRWNGEYEVMDRVSSSVFSKNIDLLCEYIELSSRL